MGSYSVDVRAPCLKISAANTIYALVNCGALILYESLANIGVIAMRVKMPIVNIFLLIDFCCNTYYLIQSRGF
ncbi:hypothetical protein, partial [Francisella tularensis]|uniref:hypothetical protein n=1 Tax=Francisella tularensis TaxID=263 RepID=UPI002381B8F0|nr:hypothetical protein [Francisella tularensis subsp. holarctica]